MSAGSISLPLNLEGPVALAAWVESTRLSCKWRRVEDKGKLLGSPVEKMVLRPLFAVGYLLDKAA